MIDIQIDIQTAPHIFINLQGGAGFTFEQLLDYLDQLNEYNSDEAATITGERYYIAGAAHVGAYPGTIIKLI